MTRRCWLAQLLAIFGLIPAGCGKEEKEEEESAPPLPPNRLPPNPKQKPGTPPPSRM